MQKSYSSQKKFTKTRSSAPLPPSSGTATQASISHFFVNHLVDALNGAMQSPPPTDRFLSSYFRGRSALGSHDRERIAEALYSVLRHQRALICAWQNLTQSQEQPQARVLSLMGLMRFQGISLSQLTPCLTEEENNLLHRLKSFDWESLNPAQYYSLPDWLWLHILAIHGEEQARLLARSLQHPAPLDLRVNTFKTTRNTVIQALQTTNWNVETLALAPQGLRLSGKPSLHTRPLFTEGMFEIQDQGSQIVAELVAPRRGEMVVDFCAGSGGKTLALGALMQSTGRLYALDVSPKRLERLRPRLARSGLSNVHPVRIENEHDPRLKRWFGKCDRVLVDAPCSGTGVIRRNPEIKWHRKPQDIDELCNKQRSILLSSARLVKIGGRLVYATCSLLEDENQNIIKNFLKERPDFVEKNIRELLKQQQIYLPPSTHLNQEIGLMLLPHIHQTDGFFVSVMERRTAT